MFGRIPMGGTGPLPLRPYATGEGRFPAGGAKPLGRGGGTATFMEGSKPPAAMIGGATAGVGVV